MLLPFIALFGAAQPTPIRTLKKQLRAIGFTNLRPDGVLDQDTVVAVNSVLQGWDDAPPRYRTGRLSMHDIAKELKTISGLVRRAVGGAVGFDNLPG